MQNIEYTLKDYVKLFIVSQGSCGETNIKRKETTNKTTTMHIKVAIRKYVKKKKEKKRRRNEICSAGFMPLLLNPKIIHEKISSIFLSRFVLFKQ